jgi:7-keto-8-aminopelargonate synthetase-like enzyme
MDGDTPNLEELVAVSQKHNCYLVVDEAHALEFWRIWRRIGSNAELTG